MQYPTTRERVERSHALPSDYQFFRERGHSARYAMNLARAERWARATDHRFIWEYEQETLTDLWEDHDQYCPTYRRAQHEARENGYSDRYVYEACDHEIQWCALAIPAHESDTYYDPYGRVGSDDILESLGGIIDADRDYRREIEAELASECLASVRNAWTSTERLTAALHR